MPWASIVAGRSCRRRGLSACRMKALLSAGAAVGAEQAHAPCIHCCWQELPPARPQHMPLACIVAGRSCRRRGTSACRLHAACMHCCWQVLPPAWHQRTLLASIVAGRSCRRRGTSTRRWHPLWLAGAAAGEATAHAACMHCRCQVLPGARLRRMPFAASSVAAAGESPAHAACIHCCGQVLPFSRHRRMPFASIVAVRS